MIYYENIVFVMKIIVQSIRSENMHVQTQIEWSLTVITLIVYHFKHLGPVCFIYLVVHAIGYKIMSLNPFNA